MDIAVDTRPHVPRVTRPRVRLGEILLSIGAITELDLERILAAQRKRREPFGQVAVALKLITEGELRHALAQQFEYPIASPGESALSLSLSAAYDPFGATPKHCGRCAVSC